MNRNLYELICKKSYREMQKHFLFIYLFIRITVFVRLTRFSKQSGYRSRQLGSSSIAIFNTELNQLHGSFTNVNPVMY